MDLSLAQTLRVVHRRAQGRREEGCNGRVRNSYIYHAIFSQVRLTYYHAGTSLCTSEDINNYIRYINWDYVLLQYICENHFQRLSKKSIFTGLKAINHFGRPDMTSFLKFVQKKHSYVSCFQCKCYVILVDLMDTGFNDFGFMQVSKIGVFSCGPRPLTKSVMSSCDEVNKGRRLPYFIHHFENFG